MRVLIAIPSKGRSEAIFKKTLRWIERTGFDVRVFCEPQEIEQYREGARLANYEYYLGISDNNFIDILENDRGLGYAKEFIKKYALENGYDLVFKMDDDVKRFNERGKNKSDDDMVNAFALMVGECRGMFNDQPEVAAVGFPYRNELFPPVKQWAAINARLQSCYIIRTEYLNSGFNCFEDFAQFIYIRSHNKTVLRYGKMGIDASPVGKNKGGLQIFDRKAQAEAEIIQLREMYPALELKKVEGKAWDYEPLLKGDFFGYKKL